MPILAKQKINRQQMEWLDREAQRLCCSRADVIRRLISMRMTKPTYNEEQNDTSI